MAQHLVLTLRLHEDGSGAARFHGMSQGMPEWPPSPARVYQALIAGAARGNELPEQLVPALEWWERLQPPVIAAPHRTIGQAFSLFVPNNDADSLADPQDVSQIRTGKVVQPSLFPAKQPLLYAWQLASDAAHVSAIVDAANDLYQLGRGIDMAWAVAEVVSDEELHARLMTYEGVVHRPEPGSQGGRQLACPLQGSLASLLKRHRASKLRVEGTGRKARVLFVNPPKPLFHMVPYDTRATEFLFDLRDTAKPGSPLASWPLAGAADLVQQLRGLVDEDGTPQSGAAKRLWDALRERQPDIAKILIGRNASDADKRIRVRIVPIPSIGHHHVNRDIRRVLVEVPPTCPLRADDIAWSFSGLQVKPVKFDQTTGEVSSSIQLVPSADRSMLRHYGFDAAIGGRTWRTVTPIAVPEFAGRRRIEPRRRNEEAKGGEERFDEHRCAAGAILQALRHAGIRARVHLIRVQREPFEAKGSRAEAFAAGTRFVKERLWHAEITFSMHVRGPLLLGDGRYMGLGLMRPVDAAEGVQALEIVRGLRKDAKVSAISAALRRAVMARVQSVLGKNEPLPTFFTGHEPDGSPARGNAHRHLAFVPDLARSRLLIVAPHMLEHREPTREEKRHMSVLAASLDGLNELRAGEAGKLELAPMSVPTDADPVLGAAESWESVTEYRVTRHIKKAKCGDALIADVAAELARRSLPKPKHIEVVQCATGRRGDTYGFVRIQFAVAVNGPLLIGRTCHVGGGLFAASQE